MGYAGLVALGLLFLSPVVTAFRWAYKARRDLRGDILLGLGVGLILMYLHSLYEWAWRITPVTYVYFMTVAAVAALSRQLEAERSSRRVTAPAEADGPRPARRKTVPWAATSRAYRP
jgi:hypothetical protein